MATQLKKAIKIWKLAQDLGIRSTGDPVSDIVRFCENRVKRFLKDFPDCSTPDELLELAANKLRTVFELVWTDADLAKIRQKYISRGEKIFATLAEVLPDEVFGITFRLSNRENWEPEFASIIDCRGTKAARRYFTKWHELAHLFVLTDQMRLTFMRTDCHEDTKDPEEMLMDVIAGRLGFFPPMVRGLANGLISFEAIGQLRQLLCAEASELSARINFTKSWPTPSILVHAELGFRANDRRKLEQGRFDFYEVPLPQLRAVRVTCSDSARELGFVIPQNMRIPKQSIIHQVFDGLDYGQAWEDFGWWEASNGTVLPAHPIFVEARRVWNAVDALIAFQV